MQSRSQKAEITNASGAPVLSEVPSPRGLSGIVFYVPEEVAATPADGHCFVNRWWTVHPDKGVAFYCARRRPLGLEPFEQDEPSPQCNSNEYTSRELTRRNHPDCIVKFLPAVFLGPAILEMRKQRAALASAREVQP